MPAHKGNRYAMAHWIERKGEERLIRVSTRIPESHLCKLDKLLVAGHSRSDLLREAVHEFLLTHGLL